MHDQQRREQLLHGQGRPLPRTYSWVTRLPCSTKGLHCTPPHVHTGTPRCQPPSPQSTATASQLTMPVLNASKIASSAKQQRRSGTHAARCGGRASHSVSAALQKKQSCWRSRLASSTGMQWRRTGGWEAGSVACPCAHGEACSAAPSCNRAAALPSCTCGAEACFGHAAAALAVAGHALIATCRAHSCSQ